MRLAVFFPASLFSAHCVSYGLVNTLKRMGHEVVAIGIDPSRPYNVAPETKMDAMIISGPEHLKISARNHDVPTVAWMHETVEREDYGKLDVEAIRKSADIVFCPAMQDEKHGFRYLPFGVDTTVFRPDPKQPRTRDAGFIGLVYPKRQEFLAKLRPLLNGTKLSVGNVQVLEVDGVNPQRTAELYALNLRSFRLFVNLPTLSQLAVTKIYEALACGTPVITPRIEHMENLDGLPLCAYRDEKECAELIRDSHLWTGLDPNQLDRRGVIERDHSLKARCAVLVNALKEIGARAA